MITMGKHLQEICPDFAQPQHRAWSKGLEVGGALRLRLEARISRQLAADSRQHKDGGQRAEEMLSVVRGPL